MYIKIEGFEEEKGSWEVEKEHFGKYCWHVSTLVFTNGVKLPLSPLANTTNTSLLYELNADRMFTVANVQVLYKDAVHL